MTEIRAPYAGRTLPVGTTAERDLRDEISQLRVQLAELDAFNNDLLRDFAALRAGLSELVSASRRYELMHAACPEIDSAAEYERLRAALTHGGGLLKEGT